MSSTSVPSLKQLTEDEKKKYERSNSIELSSKCLSCCIAYLPGLPFSYVWLELSDATAVLKNYIWLD